MDWFFLALTAAFSLATADALTKKHFSRLSAYEMGITRLTYTLPWLALALFFIPWPRLDRTFFLAFGAALPLEVLAFLCYMRAIKVSPLSLTLPFLAFTPIFIILTGRLILGETVTPLGLAGILCIVIGAYFLNLSQARAGLLQPFKAIFREPGSALMLLVSFIYSLTSTLGKLAVLHSNPYFFGVSYYIVFALLMLSFLPLMKGARAENLLKNPKAGLMVGVFMALMVISHMLAISLVEAAYMIAIKRTSLLFGVLYGAWLFRETKITERLTGAAVMTAGVLLIGFYG
ncbi:MAG TPA: DMT family transporter [Deltaproteobacteria bacterium]|nr:DMT family transporter [Deltaproteobacteria bacterium]